MIILCPTRIVKLARGRFILALLLCAWVSALVLGQVPASDQEPRSLELGKPLARELAGGTQHSYQLQLLAGQYLHLIVEQKGIDVVVIVSGPDGKKLAEMDSPNGTIGPEPISLISEVAGNYRIEVRSTEQPAAAGRYEIKLQELRAATAKDPSRIAAEQAFLAAEVLRSEEKPASSRQALKKYEEALTLWRVAEDIGGEADTLLFLAQCHISLGEYKQAMPHLEKVLTLKRTLSDRKGEAETLHQLGRAYYFSEDKTRALEYYNQALPLRRTVGDRAGEATTLNNIGLAYDSVGKRREALEYFQQALTLYRAVQDRQNEAVTLDNLGRIYSFLGEKQKSLEHYQQALALSRANGSRLGEATTLHNLGNLYRSLGDMPKAIDFSQQALTLARALGDPRREAIILTSIGTIYDDLGEKQKALEHYMQALLLRRAAKDRRGESVTLHNLGTLYVDIGEYQKAFEYFNQALTVQRALEDRLGESVTLGGIGATWDNLGEKQKALEHYNQALTLKRAMGDRNGEALTLNNIGSVYNSLGEQQKALDYYSQALPILRAIGNRFQEGGILDNIGKIHFSQGDKTKALEYYQQSLALQQAVRNRDGEATTLHNLGVLYNSLGEPQKAISYYNQSLALHQATGNRRQTAYTLHNLGRVYGELGKKEKAFDLLNQALALNQTIGDREGEATTRYGIARVERTRGNLTEAQAQMALALDLIESLRTRIAGQELRASYLASKQDYYNLSIDLLMQLQRSQPAENFAALALETSERSRARSLLETLTEARADIRQGVDATLLERERSLQQQLNAKEQARMQLLSRKHTPEQAAGADKELRELAIQYQDLQTQIKTSNPRYAALTQPQPLTLAEIQRDVLDADTLLLEFALGEECSYLWVVSQDTITSYELPKRAEVETVARSFYDALVTNNQPSRTVSTTPSQGTPTTAAATGAALSHMLLAPVAAQLGNKRLLIVADGALQYVPFAALPDPVVGGRLSVVGKNANQPPATSHQPLIIGHEIITLPSASTLAVLRRETAGRPAAAKVVAVIADPVFDNKDERIKLISISAGEKKQDNKSSDPMPAAATARMLLTKSAKATGVADARIPRLPDTRREAEAILALVKPTGSYAAFDFAANRSAALSDELGHYRIVHFATHGFLNSANPALSGLVLSLVDEKGVVQNGFLLTPEIYNLKLSATELVVLSACQTGLGQEVRGEGVIGLTRGFMYAGAPRVVVSLWSVSDRATADLMKSFYTAMLGKGLRPAAALRAAQIALWKQQKWRTPYYWAAFGLQGEWR